MLQLGRDVFIRDGRRVCAVPGAAIRVDIRIRGLREGSVNLAPLLRVGCPVDGRANERVAERHSGEERQQTFRFQNICGGRRDLEPVCRAPHKRRVADRVRRRHEQQAARSLGQPDFYPFVMSKPVVAKLQFVQMVVMDARTDPDL